MSHTGGEALGAAVALRLSVAAVFWLCAIVHLQRLVFGKDEVCDVDGPVDGMHMAMAAYMAFMFFPGYSGGTDAACRGGVPGDDGRTGCAGGPASSRRR